jgi:phosphohistidine phosphatase
MLRMMRLTLVHHGEAVEPIVDVRRPLSPHGQQAVARLAAECAARGVSPTVIWHSGKLRARQTAEEFWRACNALATFSATRDLQPDDPPEWLRDRLRGETNDILVAGHYPHLPRLLAVLLDKPNDPSLVFPLHGVVALRSDDQGETWSEEWRLADSP